MREAIKLLFAVQIVLNLTVSYWQVRRHPVTMHMARNHGHDYSTSLLTLHIINTYNPLKYGFDINSKLYYAIV